MSASIVVPIVGSITERIAMAKTDAVVELPVRVHSASYTRNDHNHADSFKLAAEWFDVGIDPRIFSSCSSRFWLGNASETGGWSPSDGDLRFAGVVTSIGRTITNEGGFSVDLEFDDYTALFLESKHYPPEEVPLYSQTLSQAWARICDHTGPLDEDGEVVSTVSALRNRLVFQGDARDVVIGKAVPKRFQSHPMAFKPDTDAWAVWQQCVGGLGLISFIYLDTCIVTTATDYYSNQDPPLVVYGRNLASLTEHREIKFSGKGVGITSFDPMSGTSLEALWPPIGDKRVKRKKIGASRATSGATSAKPKKVKPPPTQDQIEASEDRDFFSVPGVTDPSALVTIAKRVWEERSRQELEGEAVTHDMTMPTASGEDRDILSLIGGETIRIEFDPEHIAELGALNDFDARIRRSVELGYSEQVAEVLARNLAEFAKLDASFHIKTLDVEFEDPVDVDSGEFRVTIHFINRIQIEANTQKTQHFELPTVEITGTQHFDLPTVEITG